MPQKQHAYPVWKVGYTQSMMSEMMRCVDDAQDEMKQKKSMKMMFSRVQTNHVSRVQATPFSRVQATPRPFNQHETHGNQDASEEDVQVLN